MKWFFRGCAALVVGFLLVGPVHAEPQRSGQRSGQRSAHRSRLHSVHHRKAPRPWLRHPPRRVPRPWLRQLPWEWVPPQPQGFGDLDLGAGDFGPASGGFDLNSGGDQPEIVLSGGNDAQPAATSEGGAQQRPPQGNNRSPRAPGSQHRR
jgi:hypothetical protein